MSLVFAKLIYRLSSPLQIFAFRLNAEVYQGD